MGIATFLSLIHLCLLLGCITYLTTELHFTDIVRDLRQKNTETALPDGAFPAVGTERKHEQTVLMISSYIFHNDFIIAFI